MFESLARVPIREAHLSSLLGDGGIREQIEFIIEFGITHDCAGPVDLISYVEIDGGPVMVANTAQKAAQAIRFLSRKDRK